MVDLQKKSRVWIVWENWVGKSTLIKTIIKTIQPLEGIVKLHENAKYLYFSQLHESLLKETTISENFRHHGFDYSEERIGSILRIYGFGFHDGDKIVNTLSGGERSRLLFALIWQKDSHILIFDEPTNHLDYETREALEKALALYPGAILFISHDRYFINKVSEKLWIIQDNELIVSYGNYDDYMYKKEHGIDLDMTLFDASGELDLVLEEKLWKEEARRIKEKFTRKKRR
jgi:ATP-binding cassette subfamily F protein 3